MKVNKKIWSYNPHFTIHNAKIEVPWSRYSTYYYILLLNNVKKFWIRNTLHIGCTHSLCTHYKVQSTTSHYSSIATGKIFENQPWPIVKAMDCFAGIRGCGVATSCSVYYHLPVLPWYYLYSVLSHDLRLKDLDGQRGSIMVEVRLMWRVLCCR